MIPYASRTGTRRNLTALRSAEWRILVSARGVHRDEGFRYAIDNGAWTAFQRGEAFDGEAFRRLLASHGAGADWIVVPDVVADRDASLALTAAWFDEVAAVAPPLVAVQDGMEPGDVAAWVERGAGIFLGGSTEWKLAHAVAWGRWCAGRRCYYHVARVNTARRIRLCQEAGASSFDGTSASKFAKSLPRLDRARRQGSFWDLIGGDE